MRITVNTRTRLFVLAVTPDTALPWESIEAWRTRLFFGSAASFAIAGTIKATTATTGIAIPDYLLNLFGQGGFVVAFVGLLALYPRLSEQRPRLAKVGAACAALGAVSFTVALLALGILLGLNAIAGTTLPVDPVGALFIPGYLGGVLGFVLYGAAGVRTGVPSSTVGGLFLALVLVPLAQVVGFAVFGVSTSPQLIGLGPVDIWVPAVLLVVTYLLRSSPEPTDASEPSTKPAT